jgi:transcriptional regulator of heat shock response
MQGVYVLQSGDENVFKIGKAVDLERRMKNLATGNPHPLTLYRSIETEHAAECETYLHHRLRSKRSTRSDAKEFFDVEPSELEALLRDARAYVEDFLPRKAEAERLCHEQSDSRVIEPTETQQETYRRLLKAREEHDALALECERLETELKLAIGTAAAMDGVASWKTQTMHKFDSTRFSEEHPEMYEEFLHETHTRVFRLL